MMSSLDAMMKPWFPGMMGMNPRGARRAPGGIFGRGARIWEI
jgi:hypothetical protein